MKISALLPCLLALPLLAAGAAEQDGVEFFEAKIRPLLVDSCYPCHSAKANKRKGGLLVDSAPALLAGGDSGPALVPGHPEQSRLVTAIHYGDPDLQMPPKDKGGKLKDEAIAALEAWIRMGAPDPRTTLAAGGPPSSKDHWSFQPLKPQAPPTPANAAWARTDLDRFILAKLEANGLVPAPAADRRALLRRATYDLTGLQPSAEEVDAFLADRSPDAFQKVVDRLLASPHYGERWGRHWLDVARYADSKGYVFQEERRYPYAYTYRDWVVKSLNDDLPYDRFITLQIAGDQAPGHAQGDLAALGFLTVGRRFINIREDIIDDRIDVVCRGTMGLTVACARCHDHKFDPVSTKDYYALYGVFDSCDEPKDLPELGIAGDPKETAAFAAELAKREQAVADLRAKRHGERVVEARTAPRIAQYLLAVHEAKDRPDHELHEISEKHALLAVLVRRWRAVIVKAGDADPVFSTWRAYAGVADADLGKHADDVAKALAGKPVAAPIAAAFAGKHPAKLEDVAELYGKALAECDGDQPADGERERLRLVLRGPESPTAVPLADADQLFDVADQNKIRELKNQVDALPSTHPGAPARAMVVTDREHPVTPHVHVRGNPGVMGDEVPRRFISVLSGGHPAPFAHGSGRLDLAAAIADRANPLTARVLVNRVWAWHFGTGLVRTASDFGMRCDPPTHPELLDWLAARFIDEGWSLKKLHRLILASATYQQSADARPDQGNKDPDNLLLAHFPRQRLDAEGLRDGLLAVAGHLDPAVGGRAIDIFAQPFSTRRTLYGFIDRQNLPGFFRTFDLASPDAHSPRRFQTSVPQQALFLLNSPFAEEQARLLAARAGGGSDGERIQRLYRLVFARAPSAAETAIGLDYLRAAASAPHVAADADRTALGVRLRPLRRGQQAPDQLHPVRALHRQHLAGRAGIPDPTLHYLDAERPGRPSRDRPRPRGDPALPGAGGRGLRAQRVARPAQRAGQRRARPGGVQRSRHGRRVEGPGRRHRHRGRAHRAARRRAPRPGRRLARERRLRQLRVGTGAAPGRTGRRRTARVEGGRWLLRPARRPAGAAQPVGALRACPADDQRVHLHRLTLDRSTRAETTMLHLPRHLLSRRHLLQRCGMGFGALALAQMGLPLGADEGSVHPFQTLAPRPPQFPAKAKHVIHLFMNGGPSQVDTFDPKPELTRQGGKPVDLHLPTERPTGAALASPFAFKKYGKCGLEVSDLFSHVAGSADELCVIRSMQARRAQPRTVADADELRRGAPDPPQPGLVADLRPGHHEPEPARLRGAVPGRLPHPGIAELAGRLPARHLPGHLDRHPAHRDRQADRAHPQPQPDRARAARAARRGAEAQPPARRRAATRTPRSKRASPTPSSPTACRWTPATPSTSPRSRKPSATSTDPACRAARC